MAGWNVAVTVLSESMVTSQVGVVPVQPGSLHPANAEPGSGVAVRITCVLCVRPLAMQELAGHAIPPTSLVTVPVPPPSVATVRVCSSSNVAVTFFAASIVRLQVPVPLQSPLQPVKVEPASAAALSTTASPWL